MTKKRLILLSGGALMALLLVGLIGATVVFAQEPEPPVPFGWHGGGRGMGGFGGRGRGGFAWARGGQWTMFDTAAEALGLTPEELFAELHAGKSMNEIAEEQDVEPEAVHDAVSASQAEARKQAIGQAVEDGELSQEQADWMLEGLDKGFFPGGRGRGLGHRSGRDCNPEDE
jgi:hypothetical protein